MPDPDVKRGDPLGYVERLKDRDLWPPRAYRGGYEPALTPYLVVPAFPNDAGQRPLPGALAFHSASIDVLSAAGAVVSKRAALETYSLRCTVANQGANAAYAGMAEFYLSQPGALDTAAATSRAGLKALGYTGFVVQPNSTVTVLCPRTWTPPDDLQAQSSILVHVYDPISDPIGRRFDARNNRHVGRLDILPDFHGAWDGREALMNDPGDSLPVRVMISQDWQDVEVAIFYQQTGVMNWEAWRHRGEPEGGKPIASTTIVGRVHVHLTTAVFHGMGIVENEWVFSLPDPDTLYYTHQRKTTILSNPTVVEDWFGYLRRS